MRLKLGLLHRLRLIGLHQREAVIAIDVMPPQLLRAVHRAEKGEGLRETGVQRFVSGGVGEGVEDHDGQQ
jgi:hypothetical protein